MKFIWQCHTGCERLPANGQLYAATLTVQTYGVEVNPQISRFGASKVAMLG